MEQTIMPADAKIAAEAEKVATLYKGNEYAKLGSLGNVSTLIKKCNIDLSSNNYSILENAVISGNIELVKYLISLIKMKDITKLGTQLLRIAVNNNHIEIVKYIWYDFNMDCDENTNVFEECFTKACVKGYIELCKWFYESGKRFIAKLKFENVYSTDFETQKWIFGLSEYLRMEQQNISKLGYHFTLITNLRNIIESGNVETVELYYTRFKDIKSFKDGDIVTDLKSASSAMIKCIEKYVDIKKKVQVIDLKHGIAYGWNYSIDFIDWVCKNASDYRSNRFALFRQALLYGKIAIAEYISMHESIRDIKDATTVEFIVQICEKGCVKGAEWINTNLPSFVKIHIEDGEITSFTIKIVKKK